MSSNTKERLLSDLEALRHQLAEIEAHGSDDTPITAIAASIPTLEVDNIPLLGDAVPADRNEAIAAHREAMAQLDAELRELDNADQQAVKTNDTLNDKTSITPKLESTNGTSHTKEATQPKQVSPVDIFATLNATAESLLPSHLKAQTHPMATSTSSDENPFLPQHLRERLDKSKVSLLEGIARSSESMDASTALLRNFSGEQHKPLAAAQTTALPNDHQMLVDTLVAKYLPLIEADLRQRLNTSLQQQLAAQQKITQEPPH